MNAAEFRRRFLDGQGLRLLGCVDQKLRNHETPQVLHLFLHGDVVCGASVPSNSFILSKRPDEVLGQDLEECRKCQRIVADAIRPT